MYFSKLSHEERLKYLLKPILEVLQETGGQLTRSEVKERIKSMDDNIAEYGSYKKKSAKTHNEYYEFDFKFNFAIKDLSFVELIEFEKRNPTIYLTEKGMNLDLSTLDVDRDIIKPSQKFWQELSNKNKKNKVETEYESSDDGDSTESYMDEFKEKLLSAIAKMPPKKFESFSRLLLTKMGVEFTEKGVQVSNDGGIDGFGYHRDSNDFRTTRVVIQCKRYNTSPVSEPEINQFLGAMNKFKADYGVFITNSRFTSSAKNAAFEGTPLTLIDGDELVNLVIKYQLHVTPVTTYHLGDFYDLDD